MDTIESAVPVTKPEPEPQPEKKSPLIVCAGCERSVSTFAIRCPACGHPVRKIEGSTSGFTYLGALICGGTALSFLVALTAKPAPQDEIVFLMIASFDVGLLCIAIGGVITLLREISAKL